MCADGITVIGLGSGRRGALTIEALDALRAAALLYLYSERSPIVDEIRGDLRPEARIHSFDAIHDAAASTDEACALIAAALLEAAASGEPIVYAVPGHPLAGEPSTRALLASAAARGIAVRVLPGPGVLEQALAALPSGTAAAVVHIVSATGLSAPSADAAGGLQALWTGPSPRLFDAQAPLLVGPIHDERVLPGIARRLRERYPAAHMVTLIRHAGASNQTLVEAPLEELDRLADVPPGHSDPAVLCVPPLAPLDDVRALPTLGYITARLRGPGGCPWDREQTHASLTTYMIEEAYEAVDAIERGDDVELVEELGDVLLQVVLHSQLAEEEGRFSLADVAEEVNRKLVRRHPHVFGGISVGGSAEVLRNWERIKRVEKAERRDSALDGIPPALPALALAQALGRKAAKLGFDWPDARGVMAKVHEELSELARAGIDAERCDEMGDLLFALTSLCRHLGLDAEDALRGAARKFSDRFRRVETLARDRGLDLTTLGAAALDALWEESKAGQ